MQIKIFSIPLMGGDAIEQDMNRFLRAHKILKVDSKLANKKRDAVWTFEIRYVEGTETLSDGGSATKKDYRLLLDEPTFAIFSALREIRKKIAEKEGVPPYAVFTNEELAEMAKLEKRDVASIQKINGIGVKKIEKYAQYFINETHQPPA
jgi:superfamily II DNA helicase RecQ